MKGGGSTDPAGRNNGGRAEPPTPLADESIPRL